MGAGCVCVYACILWCFLLHVHVCGSACALASLSHMCGACAVSAGLGEEEEELGDSRAQRRLRQAGRQAGSRQTAYQGAWALTLRLLSLGAGGGGCILLVWSVHTAEMPLCSTMCSHPPMQACSPLLPQLLPFQTPRPLSSLSPMWFP